MSLEKRIERLEEALMRAGLPYTEQNCACCGMLFLPVSHESSRCEACLGCYMPKGDWEWVRGPFCPGGKRS